MQIASRLEKRKMSQLVPYGLIPPLKKIHRITPVFFRNKNQLGIEKKNGGCSMMGTMLQLDI